MKKPAILICMLAGVLSLEANVWRLRTNEASANSTSLTNAYGWVDNVNGSTRSGEDGDPLSSQESYLIRGGYTVNTPVGGSASDSFAFAGGSLTLGTDAQEGRIRHKLYADATASWDNWGENEGLCLVNGYYMTYYSGVAPLVSDIYGKVRVESTAEKPYRFGFSTQNVRMNLHGDFSGGENAAIRFSGINYGNSSYPVIAGTSFCLGGEWTNYFGTVEVTNTTVAFGTTVLPGVLELDGKSILTTKSTSDVFAVDTLVLAAGAKIEVKADESLLACGMIVVTNMLDMASPIKLAIDGALYEGRETAVYLNVLSVPVSANISADDFELAAGAGDAAQKMRLAIERNVESGLDTVVVVYVPNVVYQVVTDADVRDIQDSNKVPYTSSFDIADNWSDLQTPHQNAEYVVRKIDSKTTKLRTPVDPDLDYDFPGERLIIENACQFGLFYKSLNVKELVLGDNSFFMLGKGIKNGSLGGVLSVPVGTVSLCAFEGAEFTIAADIVGSARLVFDGSHANTSSRRATTKLTGENSRFTGTITVGLNRVPANVASNFFQTLSVEDPLKLGAPLSKFDPTALVLKRLARLSAVGSISFDDGTRGIYVGEDGSEIGGGRANDWGTNSEGQFYVEDEETLAVRTQLTLNGRLHKYGRGTLALGGALKFGPADGISDDPVANSNYCSIAEGFVKPLAADAFNGMELSFASGTGMRLDIDPADSVLKKYGMRNTKAGVPFAAEDKIDVKFDMPDDFAAELPFSIGVVTVEDGKYDAVARLLNIEKPSLECQVITGKVTENGNSTMTLTFKKVGTIVSIR